MWAISSHFICRFILRLDTARAANACDWKKEYSCQKYIQKWHPLRQAKNCNHVKIIAKVQAIIFPDEFTYE